MQSTTGIDSRGRYAATTAMEHQLLRELHDREVRRFTRLTGLIHGILLTCHPKQQRIILDELFAAYRDRTLMYKDPDKQREANTRIQRKAREKAEQALTEAVVAFTADELERMGFRRIDAYICMRVVMLGLTHFDVGIHRPSTNRTNRRSAAEHLRDEASEMDAIVSEYLEARALELAHEAHTASAFSEIMKKNGY